MFWKEWYQDHLIWFGIVLILQPFLETQSFTNLVTSARAIYGRYSCPWVRSLFCLRGSMGFRATMYGSPKSHYPCLKCHENEEKIENDHVWELTITIKTTQPISMILVPFFSEDNVLSDEMQFFFPEYQSNENRAFRFLGDTRYTLRKKVQLGTFFVPYLEPSGKSVPKRVLYMFKNLKRFRI